jgi:uncharacterized membrane protein YdjX (TVP38/TMEM64 family)
VAALVLLYFAWPSFQSFVNEAVAVLTSGDRQRTQAWVQGFGVWGYVVVLFLMIFQAVLAVVPSLLMMVVAVLAYGPVWGGVLAWGGLLLAASVSYGIGRALGPVTVDRLVGETTEKKISGFVEHYGLWAIIAARVSPVISTDAVSFVAGLVSMGYVRFIAATAVGTLPLTILVAWLGADIDRLESGLIWVSVVSLAAFLAYVLYDRKHRNADDD